MSYQALQALLVTYPFLREFVLYFYTTQAWKSPPMKILFYTIIIQFYRLKINKNRKKILDRLENEIKKNL